ncbi:MAG: hypothetical protein K0U78_21550 [Actinomycetia bacterium]|nr:hypothetical protein [Actinomycetes bacterium]
MLTRIAKLLSFIRTSSNDAKVNDVEIDIGGGDNRTAQHFSAPGDDSFPLNTDYVLAADVPRNGGKAAHGYLDPINEGVAQKGEKRVYGRDPATGVPVNQVWLKSDGSVFISNDNGSVLLNADGGSIATTPGGTFEAKADGSIKGDNGSGSFELTAGGDFEVNGAVIDTAGNITSPGIVSAPTIAATGVGASLTVSGKEMKGHTHSQGNDSAGDSQVNTNGPV